MDEQKIIKGLKNMEDWAVEAVIELYGDRLTKSAYTVCSDQYLAEEAVQDAFLTLCHKINSFREDSSLYTWLYRITINHARNKTRNRWFRKVLPREEEQFQETPDYRIPEQRVMEIEASDEIRRSLSMLPCVPAGYRPLLYTGVKGPRDCNGTWGFGGYGKEPAVKGPGTAWENTGRKVGGVRWMTGMKRR